MRPFTAKSASNLVRSRARRHLAGRAAHGTPPRASSTRRACPVGLAPCAPVAATSPSPIPARSCSPTTGSPRPTSRPTTATPRRGWSTSCATARCRCSASTTASPSRGFFQKNVERGAPAWVKRVKVGKRGGTLWHVLANDAATLVWLANQNCITPHVWLSRADRLERPDRMIFDLDPAVRRRVRPRAPHRARPGRRPARGRRRALRDDDGLQGHPRRRRAAAPLRLRRGARRRGRGGRRARRAQAQGPDDRVLQAQARRAAVRRHQPQRVRGDRGPALCACVRCRARRWPRRWTGTSSPTGACAPSAGRSARCSTAIPTCGRACGAPRALCPSCDGGGAGYG